MGAPLLLSRCVRRAPDFIFDHPPLFVLEKVPDLVILLRTWPGTDEQKFFFTKNFDPTGRYGCSFTIVFGAPWSPLGGSVYYVIAQLKGIDGRAPPGVEPVA